MGPFQVTALVGGDIGCATRKRRAATRGPAERYVQIADRICERGWFGQKTGRGYYLSEGGSRPDPLRPPNDTQQSTPAVEKLTVTMPAGPGRLACVAQLRLVVIPS